MAYTETLFCKTTSLDDLVVLKTMLQMRDLDPLVKHWDVIAEKAGLPHLRASRQCEARLLVSR